MISQWFMHRPDTSLTNATHAYQLVASDFQFIENQAGRMFSNIHCTVLKHASKNCPSDVTL